MSKNKTIDQQIIEQFDTCDLNDFLDSSGLVIITHLASEASAELDFEIGSLSDERCYELALQYVENKGLIDE